MYEFDLDNYESNVLGSSHRLHLAKMTKIASLDTQFDSASPTSPRGNAHPIALSLPLSEASRLQAIIGMALLFLALSITSAPLFNSSIDAEQLFDDGGLLIRKNASYAKAYLLGAGFFGSFADNVRSNVTAANYFPQISDTHFLGFPLLDQSEYSNGACAILDTRHGSPECVLMTGHEGGVSAYGICRNGTEYVTIHYILILATPTDIGGLLSAGVWVESTREIALLGASSAPECVDGSKLQIGVDLTDIRELSGEFQRVTQDPKNRWFNIMRLPAPVRKLGFYVKSKLNEREGLTLPLKKRQSFDGIIAQNAFVATLSNKLEADAPYPNSKFLYVTIYRVAGADITLPRLQFTFAVAAQAFALLILFLLVAMRNSALNTYHLVHQVLRLPTFVIIALQLLYVLYYQLFDIAYLANSAKIGRLYFTKVLYSAGLAYILLHQLDVRSAVSMWPKMTNNDSYYFARIVWMLSSLGIYLWSLTVADPEHYVVRQSSMCALVASECNTVSMMLFQHYVCLGVLLAHPVAYGVIQIIQWKQNPHEYRPADRRSITDRATSFEAHACGGALTDYYYYNTLISTASLTFESTKTLSFDQMPEYMTCSKAVRDEGFVLLGGGCNVLVRAKDLYIIMLMRALPWRLAALVNLSIMVAYVHESRVQAMRRIGYQPLWLACQRWDGRIEYPDLG